MTNKPSEKASKSSDTCYHFNVIYYEEILNVIMFKIDLDFFCSFYYALFAVNIKYAGIKLGMIFYQYFTIK